MRCFFASILLVAVAAGASHAKDRKINYKEDALECLFTKDCADGHDLYLEGRKINESRCLDISFPLTWDPVTDRLTFRGKAYSPYAVEKRRGKVWVSFRVGSDFVNFAVGDQRPTVRFRKSPKGSSEITRMLSGLCSAAR